MVDEDKELNKLRRKVDMLDDRLSEILKKRLELTKEIGMYKKKNKISMRDLNREGRVIERVIKNKVPERPARKIYNILFEKSVRMQEGVK